MTAFFVCSEYFIFYNTFSLPTVLIFKLGRSIFTSAVGVGHLQGFVVKLAINCKIQHPIYTFQNKVES